MFQFLFPIIQFNFLELRIWVLRHIYRISIKPHELKDELNGGIPNILLLIMYSVMMPQNFKEIETTLQEFELLEEYIVNSFMKFHFLKRFSITFKCTKDPVYMIRTIFTLPRNTYSVLSYPRRLCTNILYVPTYQRVLGFCRKPPSCCLETLLALLLRYLVPRFVVITLRSTHA